MLCSCGFQPMYSGNDIDVYVAPINGINGIEMRNALNARFGGAHDNNAKYTLIISLNEPETHYKAIETTGIATWQEIIMRANYTLSMKDKVIATGNEMASESYTFVRYLVASNASYNNAVSNTISELAEKIGIRTIAETKKQESITNEMENK